MAFFDHLALCAALAVVAVVVSSFRKRRSVLFPPGPAPLPLLGNYLSIPSHKPWVTFAEWSRAAGSDLISYTVFGQRTVVINSRQTAKALLDRRSAKYSDRPLDTMITLMGWDTATSLLRYSDQWRLQRRLFHESLHSTAALAYRPMQMDQVRNLLPKMHDDPGHFLDHIRSMSASIALTVSYGRIGDERQSARILRITQESVRMLSESMFPGARAVNAFPSLRHLPGWLPGMGFKAFARRSMEYTRLMKDVPWAFVKQCVADDTASPSMASRMIVKLEETSAGTAAEQAAKEPLPTILLTAGADTTVSALSTSILALLLHPQVQLRAHKEIDDVVGRRRLPDYGDRDSLPYVEAIYREVLRWHPVTPLGVPHAAYEDDVYDGYCIPKGTPVLPNVWAMTHDPAEYPEPESFRPERFIKPDGTLNNDDMRFIFGFGRRICSGQHLADATIWMMIASILAVFDVVPAKGEDINHINEKVQYSDALISLPEPFECIFKPRDAESEILLSQLRAPEIHCGEVQH